jgi:hypothetical protein
MKPGLVRWLLPLLFGTLPMVAVAQMPPQQVVLQFQMHVDAKGHPTAVEPPPGLPPSIGDTVTTWAKALRFVPASIDGVPQPATTTLRVKFDISDPQALAIAGAATGPGVTFGEQPPGPQNDGAGYFVVEFDANGQVTSVELDEEHSPMSSKKFTRWAERYLKGLHFQPETVGGQAVAGGVRIPLVYCNRPWRCSVTLKPLPGADAVVPGEVIARSVLAPADE